MDFQIPNVKDDVNVDIYEKETGNFIETVNLRWILQVLIDFINKLIKFEF